jgi:alkylation response protein AidB-like acyl-CoA dehydrogenase
MTEDDNADIEAMLLDGAEGFLSSTHSLARTRALRRGACADTAALWRGMAECGWLAMGLPESLGGAGLAIGAAAALAVRFGSALLPEPFAECAVAPATLIAAAGDAPPAAALAAGLVDGSARPCVAWQLQAGQLEPSWHGSLAATGTGWRLSGHFIGLHADASHWLVAAVAGSEPTVVVVAADTPGISAQVHRFADGSTGAAVDFQEVPVARDAALLQGDGARAALAAALDDARLVLAAQLAGVAEGALATTVAYLQQRVQFGQTIASFQAIRHRIVDLDIQRRLAFASWRHARDVRLQHGAGSAQSSAAVSAAKARCSDVALNVARAAIQLHGAIGYTEEADIGLFLGAALKNASRLGNATAHRRRYMAMTVLGTLPA